MQGDLFWIYIFGYSGESFEEFNETHLEYAVIGQFISLCHHGLIEGKKRDIGAKGGFLSETNLEGEILQFLQAHKWFLAWFDFFSAESVINGLQNWAIIFETQIALFIPISLISPKLIAIFEEIILQMIIP